MPFKKKIRVVVYIAFNRTRKKLEFEAEIGFDPVAGLPRPPREFSTIFDRNESELLAVCKLDVSDPLVCVRLMEEQRQQLEKNDKKGQITRLLETTAGQAYSSGFKQGALTKPKPRKL